jgi:hypothetical protein
MSDEKIVIKSTIPGLADKIKTHIDDSSDMVHWYIKFNIPLDPESVSDKTMDVTDTDGFIMRTDISYHGSNNMIIISPQDSYEQNRYYLLAISKKVRSQRGQNLKREIHIMFKLKNNRISDYKVLPPNVAVPKPRRRPKDYDQKYTKSKAYSAIDTSVFSSQPTGRMPMADIKVNFIVGLLGLPIAVAGIVLSSLPVIFIGMAVCLAGVGHILYQMVRPQLRSVLQYNAGARYFNKGSYREAEACFKRACEYDLKNEMAEYALDKVSYFLS